MSVHHNNHAKLLAILSFMASTPDQLIADADELKEGKVAVQKTLDAYRKGKAFGVFQAIAVQNGWVDEKGMITKAGESAAQASLNARPGGNTGGKLDFAKIVDGIQLSGMFALQAALTEKFKKFFKTPNNTFVATGKPAQLLQDTANLFDDMCGLEPAEVIEEATEEPASEEVTGEV